MSLRDRPLLTDIYELADFRPESGSAYVFAASGEQRSAHSSQWQSSVAGVTFVQVTDQGSLEITLDIGGQLHRVPLRSLTAIDAVWPRLNPDLVYLDITGLSHHVWAPLLRSSLQNVRTVRVVYVEPSDYRFSPTPTEGQIFDLSESIQGIAPIPGFASLVDGPVEQVCFVPLLGFEGPRFAYILEQVQPPGGKIVPIIGVPGFRIEFPFHAYLGNRSVLSESRAWKDVRFAAANCPFSLFYLLQDIAAQFAGDRLVIAPIGTKPHALGAVLFCLASAEPAELVYDHPIRKPSRTAGAARLLVYHVSSLQLGR